MLDCDVLSVFSVYDQKMEKAVPYLKSLAFGSFVVLGLSAFVCNVLYISSQDYTLFFLTMMLASVYSVFGIIFDNIQSIYLVFLVFRKSKIINNERKQRLLQSSVFMIAAACGFDWLCLTGYITAQHIFQEVKYYRFVTNLIAPIIALHVTAISLILLNLQHLALDHILDPKIELVTTNRHDIEAENMKPITPLVDLHSNGPRLAMVQDKSTIIIPR
jgi:hypothetical protein